MSSWMEKVPCKKCGSEDCNHTVTTGKITSFELIAYEVYCNTCGFYARRLMVNGKELVRESD